MLQVAEPQSQISHRHGSDKSPQPAHRDPPPSLAVMHEIKGFSNLSASRLKWHDFAAVVHIALYIISKNN
jgi:hypothetical protein